MIEGMESLERKLAAIGDISTKPGIEDGIYLVQEDAKNHCPENSGALRENIFTNVRKEGSLTVGVCYTNEQYGPYVELGTGPRGQENHAGISPNVDVYYNQSPWWIHESQFEPGVAENYRWFYIDTVDGRFYQCLGQPAQPYLYPALKNNEGRVTSMVKDELLKEIRRISK